VVQKNGLFGWHRWSQDKLIAGAMPNLEPIVHRILEDYALPRHGTHGVGHWAKVLEKGLRLAEVTGASALRPRRRGCFDRRHLPSYNRGLTRQAKVRAVRKAGELWA
jgi:hypothetical protein